MKKIETSMKICNGFRHVYRVGYCDLQYIAPRTMIEPQYYNCGVYGWNCDLYVDYSSDTIITTGYRNTRGASVPAELLDKYSARAGEIEKTNFKTWNEKQKAYHENFGAFIAELNGGDDNE